MLCQCERVPGLLKTVPRNLDYFSTSTAIIADQLPRGSQLCKQKQGHLPDLLESVDSLLSHQYETTRCERLAHVFAGDTTLVTKHRATRDPAHTVEHSQSRHPRLRWIDDQILRMSSH